MLSREACFSVMLVHRGLTKSSIVTATKALMLDDTVLMGREIPVSVTSNDIFLFRTADFLTTQNVLFLGIFISFLFVVEQF